MSPLDIINAITLAFNGLALLCGAVDTQPVTMATPPAHVVPAGDLYPGELGEPSAKERLQ